MALVPLVPAYSDRFGLTKLEAGLLLASASLTILVSSIPATVLSDRYGARRVTLVAVAVMALSDVGQGAANSFWMLLAARMLFGIAFGTLWVSGVAWLAEEAGSRQARALSLTITTAGLGGIVGPAFAGVLVQPCKRAHRSGDYISDEANWPGQHEDQVTEQVDVLVGKARWRKSRSGPARTPIAR